jgi:hypothetical protein
MKRIILVAAVALGAAQSALTYAQAADNDQGHDQNQGQSGRTTHR